MDDRFQGDQTMDYHVNPESITPEEHDLIKEGKLGHCPTHRIMYKVYIEGVQQGVSMCLAAVMFCNHPEDPDYYKTKGVELCDDMRKHFGIEREEDGKR